MLVFPMALVPVTGDAIKKREGEKEKHCFGNNALLNCRDCKSESVEIGRSFTWQGNITEDFFSWIA